MAQSSQERGVRRPASYRYGITVGPCIGIWKQPDPGAIPNEAMQDMVNARIAASGRIASRGGQQKAITNAQSGCIYGLADVPTPEGLYLSQASKFDTYISLAGGSGTYTRIFNASSPVLMGDSEVSAVTGPRRNAFIFHGKVHLVDTSGTFYELVKDDGTGGGTLYSTKELFSLPLGDTPSSFASLFGTTGDGKVGEILYIGSFSSGLVYSWDGISLKTEFNTGTGTRQIVGFGHDDIYVCGTGYIRKRLGGAWTSLSMPSGSGTFSPNCAAFFQDKFVVGGESPAKIISVDGTGATSNFRTPASAARIADMDIFDSMLVYAWDATANFSYLGTYDGASFIDQVVTFVNEPSANIYAILNADTTLFVTAKCGNGGISDRYVLANVDDLSPFTFDSDNALADLGTLFGDTFAPPTMVMA